MFKKNIFTLIMGLVLTSCQSASYQNKMMAKNAILFVGDGMGPAQMTAGRLYKGGSLGKMNYENFTYTGFSKTYSSDNYTTDSAAGATALASGTKSYNGSIGMSDPRWEKNEVSRKLETIADLAKAQGKSVGIITTTRITHATPACFFAHAISRDSEEEIAQQVLDSNIDLWMGGGKEFFIPHSENGKRKDERNILKLMEKKGGKVVSSLSEVKKIPNLNQQVLALFSDSHIGYKAEGKSEALLSHMVEESIRLLSQNPNGYFLLVEGGRVDHASHINMEENMMAEMVDLDNAIGLAMKDTNPKETLIVLTADHETAGVAINGYGPYEKAEGRNILGKTIVRNSKEKPRPIITWATGPGKSLYNMYSAAHTAVDVPIGAIGPGSHLISGWMDNTQIAIRMAHAMGLNFSSAVNLNSIQKLENLQSEKRK
jgi:alkaline phosphatase